MTNPTCSAYTQCGACQLLDVPYSEQLSCKQAEMESLFAPLSSDDTHFFPILGMEDPYYYRNKVISPYAPGRTTRKTQRKRSNQSKKKAAPRQEILCGMYAAGTHRIIPTDDCLIENTEAKRVILAIRSLMLRYHMDPYNEDAHTGFVRHAVVRAGHNSGELLVTLVTNGASFPGSRNFCRELVRRVPAVTTIVQNINTRQTNVILGPDEKTLYGPGFILDELCGLSFRISSHSFYQVNATQTEMLYRRAIELADLTGTETVLDAYCGTGTIGLVAAHGLTPGKHAHRVIGVDNVTSAVHDARQNAAHNCIENADFTVDDAGAFMQRRAKAGETLDVLLIDPPRTGSTKSFLSAACMQAPKRIVYISCDPRTQKRDARYLTTHGYTLRAVQPVDMFPHTRHIENICLFEQA